MGTSGTKDEFVELGRTFHDLPKNSGESDDVYIRGRMYSGKPLTWADLTHEFRIIVLSEAGTGKTAEIRHLAKTLRADRKAAFFLRLENIRNDFEEAFEVGSCEEFAKWVASNDEGWLLLDSVDEARLRDPSDFEFAIRKLARRINLALQRVHIIITGRTVAWRPKTDLDQCITQLPFEPSSVTAKSPDDEPTDEDSGAGFRTENHSDKKDRSVFKVVSLDDLVRDQIKTFATAKGVNDPQEFLDAVERADAWSFTARPQDLEELTEFWNDQGRIGSQLEIIQNSIDRRLTERDQDRADARPISIAKVREGARMIAAAATMVKEQTIRVPDGADNSKGIPIAEILPDWNDSDIAVLLSRPIFDEAIYGTVRFHHRSVREFLTAEWLAELLNRETSRRKIESILFQNKYGLDVVVPTMRPVLPWLAIRDEKIRERLCKVAPEVLLEGGDPSKLPLVTRKRILHEVCEQVANGATSRLMVDYAAVQRFANEDLVADVKESIAKYSKNDDITWFLFRMIWQGELKEALPEAKANALSALSSKFTRIAAFRAVQAVGSPKDMEEVRASFLRENSELNRDWLAELLYELEPTADATDWLLACLNKVKPKNPNATDELTDTIAAFVKSASVELLPIIVSGLDLLLDATPVFERRHCEISQKFGWLTRAAAHAIERLIEIRNPASLERDALDVLHKLTMARQTDIDDYSETKFNFSTLVPAWPELNRASFWYEVEKGREWLDKSRGERLTEFSQLLVSRCFSRFDETDFEYSLNQIGEQTSPDDKLVAMSLAFRLYIWGGRERKQRERLKTAAAGDNALSERLHAYLHPPARGRESWKRNEARYRRRTEKWERKQAEYRDEWRSTLKANSEKLRNSGLKPDQVSRYQWYVHEFTMEKDRQFARWTSGNWKCLVEEFGEEVARAYRDGAIKFWRGYRPKLRSEGAPANTTPVAVVFGLTGLEIESIEMSGWLKGLNPAEIELACRYASFELNGFPNWFAALYSLHPSIVSAFLIREIRFELSIEKAKVESHYILSDISYSGQWAWNELAPEIYKILKAKEPKNLSNLDRMLKIVQGSTIRDSDIAALASRKSRSLKKLEHAAHWFAVWIGVDPEPALPALSKRFKNFADPKDCTAFATHFIRSLVGGRGSVSNVRNVFHTPRHLKYLYLLMNQYIQVKEDIHRAGGGGYSPGPRDEAQSARDTLAELIRSIPGKEAFIALTEIAKDHPEEGYKPWFAQQAMTKAETDADIEAWSPRQVHDFHVTLERTPVNHRDLAELAYLRLLDLKDDLENGDSSIADIIRRGADRETDIRKYLGHELREKAFDRYNIPQEEELADAKKLDLRFHGKDFDGPVPCELKLADKWTGPKLYERLENQLCGDYLRDNRSNRGFFVLVYQGEKQSWEIPGTTKGVDFDGLVIALQNHWEAIAMNFPDIDQIEVIGIDLTKRSGKSTVSTEPVAPTAG